MKNLKNVLVLALLTLSVPTIATAQKGAINVGAHGGLNISKLCCGSLAINEDYEFGEGPTFGLTGSYGVNNWLSVVAELNYTTQGGKKDGMQAVGYGNTTLYANFKNKTVLNYLELPVMARATFGKNIKYYVNAGIFAGYLLAAKHETSGTSAYYVDKEGKQPYISEGQKVSFISDKDVKDQVNDFNYGLTGGLGAGYTFGKHGIWLDGRYIMGVSNVLKNTSVNGENSTGSIMATVGYTYTLCR